MPQPPKRTSRYVLTSPFQASSDFSEDFEAFEAAEDMEVGLADALELLPNSAPVRGQALPVTAYTAGDTTLESEKPLPDSPLATLPSRITRRFTPTKPGERAPGPEPPNPTFTQFDREEVSEANAAYPAPRERARTASRTSPLKKAQAASLAKPSFGGEVFTAPADPNAVATLRALGLPIPEEMQSALDRQSAQAPESGGVAPITDAPLKQRSRQHAETPLPLIRPAKPEHDGQDAKKKS